MRHEKKRIPHFGRLRFLGWAVAVAACATASVTAAEDVPDGRKPNILLIMTDQQTASALSCAGNAWLNTPAMDSIGVHGTRFERAYVTQPLCLPFRSSFQTARYPHEIGTVTNGSTIEGEFPMLGHLVREAGYHCAYIGKWHVGASFERAGYEEASNYRPDHRKTEAAVAFLKRKHRKPFFLTVSYMNPHNVCQLARGQELPDGPIGSPPDDPDELPPLPSNFRVPANEPTAIRKVQKRAPEHYPTRDWGELEWRQYLWGYYRLVEKVDVEIGRVLDVLRDSEYGDHTVVLFLSDHGEGIAMHHWNQKQILYDQSTRVPLLITMPGGTSHRVSTELVSVALDVPVTILDLAGAERPESMRGISLRSLLTGETDRPGREFVVAQTVFARGTERLGLRGRMIRTRQFKYCVYDVGENREQLFDMVSDPGETKNLAVAAHFREELNRHRRLLVEWARETNDDGFPYVQPERR